MNNAAELSRLQTRLKKITPFISPPKLRLIEVHPGEAQPNPADLSQWDLVVNIECKEQ